jgi:hypothetical protein
MPVIKYQEFIPHTVLQDYVKRFWTLEKEYTAEDSVEEVTPDARIELILSFGSAYVQVEGTMRRELPKVCLIGLQSKPLIFQADGVLKIVAVRFFAWGALPFLKDEVRTNSTMKVESDAGLSNLVPKIAAKVYADEYQKAVVEVEDFLIGKRLNALFEPRQVRAADTLMDAQYADRPHLRPIYEAIVRATRDLGEFVVQARKGYVSLVTPRRTFARVQATTRNRVDLGLRLDGTKAGGRLQPSRIHETMKLQIGFAKLEDVDAEPPEQEPTGSIPMCGCGRPLACASRAAHG